MARLTEEQVLAIRSDHRSYSVIAAAYGISRSHIGGIKTRRFWKHLTAAIGIILFVSCAPTAHAQTIPTWKAEFVECFDGDTCKMRVEVWPDVVVTTQVRFRGIDTPERAGACAAEKMLANAARVELVDLLQAAEVITLTGVATDKYGGRVLATVAADGVPVGALLIEQGLARPYAGGTRQSWCVG